MKKQNSNPNGVSSDEAIETLSVMQSLNAVSTQLQENRPISVMLDTTAPQSHNSPPTPNSQERSPNANYASLIHALAVKLSKLVEWRKVELADGRHGYALFFDSAKWLVDPDTKELTPLGG